MSTKTTLKRIALVAVSALGFGVMSAVPSLAVVGSVSLSTTSLTVVGGTTGSSGSGAFYVDVFEADGDPIALTGTESISVTVTGAPAFKANGVTAAELNDITIQAIVAPSTDTTFTTCGTAVATSNQVPNGGGTCVSNNYTYSTDATSGSSNRYWFAVYPSDSDAVDATGFYTLRVRTTASDGFIRDTSLKVRFVTSAADSGATLTVTNTGVMRSGAAYTYTTANNTKVVLADANGGRVQKAAAANADLDDRAPVLSAALTSSLGVDRSEGLSIDDTGVAGTDHVAPADGAALAALASSSDGVYGVTDSSVAAVASTTDLIRIRYGTAEKTAAITILGSSTADLTKVDVTHTATGLKAGEELIKSNVETTTTYYLPLSTKSGTVRINIDDSTNTAIANQSMTVRRVWSGAATADVTPASQTAGTTATTDASGNIDVAYSNSNPVDGAKLTLTVSGFNSTYSGFVTDARTIEVVWQAAAVNSISILDPVEGVRVLAGSTNTFTIKVTDQFGSPVAGESVRPSITGSTNNNYSATTTYATVTTGADGTATWSLKDAAAIAGSDNITFTTVTNAKTASIVMTYVTTLPAVATLRAFYNLDATATGASINTLVPSTGIYETGTNRLNVTVARNYSRAITATTDAGDDLVAYKVEALTSAGASATGAPVTVTAGTGGYILGADGLPTTSRTFPVASSVISFIAGARGTGAVTFTITSGSVSITASQWMENASTDARYVKLTSAATTATAFGDPVAMTATVEDRFGNPVSGVDLTLTATGVANFSGGATTQSFKTDSTGKYSFQGTSVVEAGGAGTFTATIATAGTDSGNAAGRAGAAATAVDSTLTAGAASASATVTFAAGRSAATVAAEAATDAALEAIDAANAATDAANLAAEAADAATVAAEEARDAADAATAAVEALASEVATLISGLKAQITTLANTVAKIAKKVKA